MYQDGEIRSNTKAATTGAAIWHVHLKIGNFYRSTLSKEITLLINSLSGGGGGTRYASVENGIALKVISSFVLNILVPVLPKRFQPTFHSSTRSRVQKFPA